LKSTHVDSDEKQLEKALLEEKLKEFVNEPDSPKNFANSIRHVPLEREFEDYKAAAEQRHNNLDNMSKIVGRLMNKGN
jgi:hypothetical protein